ncbi:hypothetical protein [Cytobacillus sp.]|uniref:hypothetical protein n=1 Tax=Cytobacillus sp. TaxID=2675269 RepID=UPI0028BE227E|nr:hypothetical protein [Cytobacillus sp.]
MSHQIRGDRNQKGKSPDHKQGSGTEYHRKHADHLEGYGQPYPDSAEHSRNQ